MGDVVFLSRRVVEERKLRKKLWEEAKQTLPKGVRPEFEILALDRRFRELLRERELDVFPEWQNHLFK